MSTFFFWFNCYHPLCRGWAWTWRPYNQLIAEHTLRISPSVPDLMPMLLIFTMDLPNSTLKLNPSKPLTPKKRWTKFLVEESVHNIWSDSSTPRPFLKFEKKDASNWFWLPVSNSTRLVVSPFCGQSACNWGRKLGLILGSAPFPVVVKLYNLFLKNWQAEVPMVWPPSHDINVKLTKLNTFLKMTYWMILCIVAYQQG